MYGTAAGAPPWYVGNVVRLFDVLRRGAQAEVRGTVEALCGHEPGSVRRYLRDHAGSFA